MQMLVGLHDSDETDFPNYALMKISAWHKAQGDSVEWWTPLLTYDRVYSSKVFTFTPENPYLPENTIKGGWDTDYMVNCRKRLTIYFLIIRFIRKLIMQSDF